MKKNIKEKLGEKKKSEESKVRIFDPDLVQYFLHLSAIAYEPWPIVKKLMKEWYENEGIKYVRFGHEGTE